MRKLKPLSNQICLWCKDSGVVKVPEHDSFSVCPWCEEREEEVPNVYQNRRRNPGAAGEEGE